MTSHIYRLTELEKNSFKKALTLLLIVIFALMGGVSRAQKLGSVYNSQDKNLSVKKGTSLEKALEILKQDYDIGFLYKPKLLEGKKVHNDLVLPKNFDDALKIILEDHGLKFKRLNSQTYGIYKAKIQNSVSQPTQKTVTGNITDTNTGEALPGANIVLKGTTTGTTSDKKGQYSITVPSRTDTLIFSFVGYVNKTVPIKGREEINVKLKSQTIQGESAVVTAYGVRKAREDVVGAVTSLSQDQLNNLKTAPTANLTTSLSGRIPGIIAFQRSGEPGENNAEFFVRGVTTFGYNKSPLILIDDIESSTDDLADLNPNDIEDFSVLKDATATSLYGSRAANGVLIITTKTGRQGSVNADLRVESNISMPTQVPDLADPITYMKQYNDATVTRNPLLSLPFSNRKVDKTANGNNPYLYPATDWYDELFKNYTANQRISLNVSGGGEIARYYIAGSFNKSNGLLKVPKLNDFNSNIDLKNYSLRSNINVDLTKTTEISLKLSGNFDNYQGPLNGGKAAYNSVVHTSPVLVPPSFPIDSAYAGLEHTLYGGYNPSGTLGNQVSNPYADMTKGYRAYNKATINTQFRVSQNLSMLTPGLEISGLLNIKNYSYNSKQRTFNPYYYQAIPNPSGFSKPYSLRLLNPEDGNNFLSYTNGSSTTTSNFFLRAKANYNHTYANKHGVSGLFVFTARNQTYDNVTDLYSSLPHRNVNVAMRLTYNYNHKYYAEFNLGANASERFARKHRWGYFPSFGLAWNISNESFWKPINNAINRLKLSATYGFSGNDNIGSISDRFRYLSNVVIPVGSGGGAHTWSSALQGGDSYGGVYVKRYANPSLTWERAKKLNLGITLGLFNQFELRANFFRQKRTNIAQERAGLPSTLGLEATPRANTGAIEVNGFDSHINYQFYHGSKWSLAVRGNFTYSHSKFLQYSERNYPDEPYKSHIGQSINQPRGLLADRLFVDQGEVESSPAQQFGEYSAGDLKFRDVNDDGVVNNLDKLPIGFPTTPEINYGFGFSAAYKTIDLSAFFNGIARESFFIRQGDSGDNIGTAPFIQGHQVLKAYADHHWTEKNQNITALYPRFSTPSVNEGFDNNERNSTWFLRNGSVMRLRKVEFGYSLPATTISKLNLRSVRIYINGRNLLHFSKFDLWDPEMAGNGLGYPLQRTYNIGINIKL